MGVEQEEVEGQPATEGVVSRALQSLEEVLRSSYYSTSILVALFMMREWLLLPLPLLHPLLQHSLVSRAVVQAVAAAPTWWLSTEHLEICGLPRGF